MHLKEFQIVRDRLDGFEQRQAVRSALRAADRAGLGKLKKKTLQPIPQTGRTANRWLIALAKRAA